MKSLRIFILFALVFVMVFSSSSVSLAKQSVHKNLAPNPSFEKANKEKLLPAGWILGEPWCCNAGTFSWVTGNAYDGKYSISVSDVPLTEGAVWRTQEPLHLYPVDVYTFSVYMKGDIDTFAIMQVYSVDANGNLIDPMTVGFGTFNNSTWTYNEINFSPPAGAVGSYLVLGAAANGLPTTGTIYFDNVSLKLNY